MRTVGTATISQALVDTQSDGSKTPYIKVYINGVDYSSRLEYIEHHEEAYRDRAVIGLNNRDCALDTLDLDGYEFEIGYGYNSTAHGGSATDKVDTATLWVKSHQIISVEGDRIYQIYAEGMWMALREMKVMTGVTGEQTVAYANLFNKTHTVEALAKLVINAMGWTWTAITNSDGIMNVFKPVFGVSQSGFESAAGLLYRLIWMTKCYYRARAPKTIGVVYPQEADAVDETYYSYQHPYFKEHDEKSILLIPNSIVVLCDLRPDEDGVNRYHIFGTASDATQIAKYREVVDVYEDGSIDNQTDANQRAAAVLTRIKAEILGGRFTLPFHDPRVELYDKVLIIDTRGI